MECLKTTQKNSKLHLQKTACQTSVQHTFLKKHTHILVKIKYKKKHFTMIKNNVFKIMHKNRHVCLKHTQWEDCTTGILKLCCSLCSLSVIHISDYICRVSSYWLLTVQNAIESMSALVQCSSVQISYGYGCINDHVCVLLYHPIPFLIIM